MDFDLLRGYLFFVENKKEDPNKRLEVALDLINKLDKLYRNDLNNYLFFYYRFCRSVAGFYFEQNNYELSEKFFEKSLLLLETYSSFDLDSFTNKCISKEMLSHEKMMIFLKTKKKSKLLEAKNLLDFICDNFDDNWSENFKESFNNRINIYKNIIDDNFKTVVTMTLPYHLILCDDCIEFVYEDIKCSIICETINCNNSFIQVSDNIYNDMDLYGLFHKTRVTIIIFKYLDPHNKVKVNDVIPEVFEPLSFAINVFNYFKKIYVVSTKRYWLNDLNENMILDYSMKVFAGDIELHNIPLSASLNLTSTSNKSICLSDDLIDIFKIKLRTDFLDEWLVYYYQAKKYYLIKDYKNAIIFINIALENFSYFLAKNILLKYKGDEYANDFLNGKFEYNDFYLKDYISEENFDSAITNGIIVNNPPSIFAIFKEIRKYELKNISRSKINTLLSKIKDQRNNIVHGKEISKDLRFVFDNAIKSFDELLKLLSDEGGLI